MIRTFHAPLKLTALALAALFVAAPAMAQSASAKVNGKPVPQNIIDFIVSVQKKQGQPDSPELRAKAREIVINQQILLQEAQKLGYEKKPDIKAQMDLARQDVLIKAYVDGYAKSHPISADTLKKAYDAEKARVGDKEYKARHILVDKEEEAKDIIAKLKKGEKFESLAAQSKDPGGSKEKGGDLGWAAPSNYVKPFADALVKLNKGQYTDVPVKSDYGFHVIQLDETRPAKFPSFDEVKPQIEAGLQQQQFQKQFMELRAKAKVE